MPREHWESQATNWAEWARTPDFDAYWKYAPLFFDLIPGAGQRTLEVGCGEGRVCRDLADMGHSVTGVDASATLLRLARQADPDGCYLLADASFLPFTTESFDLVVAYNSLMDVDDMPGSVIEAARVLRRGGTFCICVTHPLADAGHFESRDGDAPFVIEDTYLGGRRPFEVEVERDGLSMHFKGWAYPLEDYFVALEAAGLLVQAVREPAAPGATVATHPSEKRWRRIPNFLFVRALK
jgi:SAM-dependent methyltransferase